MSLLRLVKWNCGGSLGLVLFLCTCLSLLSLDGCGAWTTTFQGGDDYDPPSGTCDNAGVSYAETPFHGWPQQGRGWADVNYFYCDPVYEAEFSRVHWGIDIEAYHREPVYATGHATVAWAYHDLSYGMGKTVKLCTGGWCAIYMHLDEWVVSPGQVVQPGDLLGYADNTGFSTGTHLHYQINNPAGQPVDPAPTF